MEENQPNLAIPVIPEDCNNYIKNFFYYSFGQKPVGHRENTKADYINSIINIFTCNVNNLTRDKVSKFFEVISWRAFSIRSSSC